MFKGKRFDEQALLLAREVVGVFREYLETSVFPARVGEYEAFDAAVEASQDLSAIVRKVTWPAPDTYPRDPLVKPEVMTRKRVAELHKNKALLPKASSSMGQTAKHFPFPNVLLDIDPARQAKIKAAEATPANRDYFSKEKELAEHGKLFLPLIAACQQAKALQQTAVVRLTRVMRATDSFVGTAPARPARWRESSLSSSRRA